MNVPLSLILAPFFFQGGLMFFDEFYYHRIRGLPLWEVWGHPLDTLTVLSCYLFIFNNPLNSNNVRIYIGLVTVSCLFVSKDEFVHSELCSPGEQWLHALLFIIHPITLGLLGFLWPYLQADNLAEASLAKTILLSQEQIQPVQMMVKGQFALIIGFLIFQITYWGIPWKTLLEKKL
jgi:hypothetical protein